jgi:signal transduction histidine kinase
LGLALAAEVTRLHQGTIWVESAARKGSTFWVRLPNSPPKQNG